MEWVEIEWRQSDKLHYTGYNSPPVPALVLWAGTVGWYWKEFAS